MEDGNLKEKKNIKNKKAFTLTEILVVIAIVGVIVLVAVPAILNISKKVKNREYEVKVEAIKTAAESYAKNNPSKFGKNETKIKVPIIVLLYNGYLTNDVVQNDTNCEDSIGCIINPNDGSNMNQHEIEIEKINSVVSANLSDATVADSSSNRETKGNITITYIANGVKLISKTESVCYGSEKCTVKLPTITPSNHYAAQGWSTDKNASNAEYKADTNVEFTNSTTLYAIQAQLYVCYNLKCEKTCSSGTAYTSESAARTACQNAGCTTCGISSGSSIKWIKMSISGHIQAWDNRCDGYCAFWGNFGCQLRGKVDASTINSTPELARLFQGCSSPETCAINSEEKKALLKFLPKITISGRNPNTNESSYRSCAESGDSAPGYLYRVDDNKHPRNDVIDRISNLHYLYVEDYGSPNQFTYDGYNSSVSASCSAGYTQVDVVEYPNIPTIDPITKCAGYAGYKEEE